MSVLKIFRGSMGKVLEALVAQHNQNRENAVGSNIHYAVTSHAAKDDGTAAPLLIEAANPTSLATRIALANDIKKVLNAHYADMLAHRSVQTAAIATADAIDEATAITLANACKASYNTGGHINTANVHANNDATNTIAAVNASDTASLDTLLTELKTDINAHIQAALAGAHILLID